MSLGAQLEADLVAAMKDRDVLKVSCLRMLKSAAGYYKIERKKEVLEDQDLIELLQKQVKQRKESFESYEKAGRKDLSEKEARELVILQAYLPKEMSDEELTALAREVIGRTGAKAKADLGRVMKDLVPLLKGRADGKRASAAAASLLV